MFEEADKAKLDILLKELHNPQAKELHQMEEWALASDRVWFKTFVIMEHIRSCPNTVVIRNEPPARVAYFMKEATALYQRWLLGWNPSVSSSSSSALYHIPDEDMYRERMTAIENAKLSNTIACLMMDIAMMYITT